ncbi:MAG: hypothetical protein NC084_13335 [Bacteroides sp.]|nr:hypothetical protein [Bacteroides sp.]
MKKILTLALGFMLAMSLTACNNIAEPPNSTDNVPQQSSNDSSSTSTQTQTSSAGNSDDTTGSTDDKPQNGGALVAYFAYSENMGSTDGMSVDAVTSASMNRETDNTEGNLQIMAQIIAEQKNADVFHILMTDPYDHDYSTMLPRAIDEMSNEDYPALQNKIDDLESYDVVYLGIPVWNSEIPPALHTFFLENDLSGKKIVLFGIHLGSRLGRMENQVKELSGGELIDSFTVTASNSNDDVRNEFGEWLAGINAE